MSLIGDWLEHILEIGIRTTLKEAFSMGRDYNGSRPDVY